MNRLIKTCFLGFLLSGLLFVPTIQAETLELTPFSKQRGGASGADRWVKLSSDGSYLEIVDGDTDRSGTSVVFRIETSTGSVIMGSDVAVHAQALLEGSSTTKVWLPPRMTTTQRDAVSSPAEGSFIWNSTNGTMEQYNGSAWESIGN